MIVVTEGTINIEPDGGITVRDFDFDAEGGETTAQDFIASRVVMAAARMQASRSDRVEALRLIRVNTINEAE